MTPSSREKSCTLLPVQCHLLPPKGGADMVLYSPKVFGVVDRWKADFQGACQADSSQSWEGCREHKPVYVGYRGPSEGKCKLLNVVMLVLLYGAPIWDDAINAREYRRTEMVSVQWKTVLRRANAYCTVSTEAVCVLAGMPLIEIVVDERQRVYSAICWINPKSGKTLWVRRDEKQVTHSKWNGSLAPRKESGPMC